MNHQDDGGRVSQELSLEQRNTPNQVSTKIEVDTDRKENVFNKLRWSPRPGVETLIVTQRIRDFDAQIRKADRDAPFRT